MQSSDHLGFGLGFRPQHYHSILNERPSGLDWLEVISENFMNIGGKPLSILQQARDFYPIAIHGVGLSIGSPEKLDQGYLKAWKHLVDWLKPVLISDHLCLTSLAGHNSHDLLPVPLTKGMLDRISERVDQIHDLLGQRFLLENPSAYVAFAENDFSEEEFFARLIERTGCGVLLDVNNLFVNRMNLGLDPQKYLSYLPEGSVGQIHLAGHTVQETDLGVVRIDTHDQPILDEVWSLYSDAVRKFPEAAVMIEWDDHIPELDLLLKELNKARELRERSLSHSQRYAQTVGLTTSSNDKAFEAPESEKQLERLFYLCVDENGVSESDGRLEVLASELPVPRLLGAQVYNRAYFARLRDVLKNEFPTLAGVTTDDGFEAIAASFLSTYPPNRPSLNGFGKELSKHLREYELSHFDFGVPQTVLADIASLDQTRSEMFTHASVSRTLSPMVLSEISPEVWETVRFGTPEALRIIEVESDVATVWQSIHDLQVPEPPSFGRFQILVWRQGHVVRHKILDAKELILIAGCLSCKNFATIARQWQETANSTEEFAVHDMLQVLVEGIKNGTITEVLT